MKIRDIIQVKHPPKAPQDPIANPDRDHPEQIHTDVIKALSRKPLPMSPEGMYAMYGDPEYDLEFEKKHLENKKIRAEIEKIEAEAARARAMAAEVREDIDDQRPRTKRSN